MKSNHLHLPRMKMTTVRSAKLEEKWVLVDLLQLWQCHVGSSHIRHRRNTEIALNCSIGFVQMCHFQLISIHRRASCKHIVQFHWHSTHDTATASNLFISTKIYIAIVNGSDTPAAHCEAESVENRTKRKGEKQKLVTQFDCEHHPDLGNKNLSSHFQRGRRATRHTLRRRIVDANKRKW